MKKLDIKLGGHHLTGDDLLYSDAGILEALTKFLDTFLGDFVILTGCETWLTSGNTVLNWNAGWIYMQGEIFEVVAGTVAYSGTNYWEIVTTYDPAGNQQYEDLNTEDTYIVRKAAPTGTGGGPYSWLSPKRLDEFKRWNNLYTLYQGAWATGSGAATQFGFNLSRDVIFRGNVAIVAYNVVSDAIIATLPATHRPNTNSRFLMAPAIINGTKTIIHIEINGSGHIKPLGLSASDAATIYLDGLRFTPGV